ncbi:hypothetical protein LG272_06365 [Pseudidiomarina marina]|uniref:hypothetical protein n=1 Tax=Pseudidiomarina marina TaxID=502366 RepID=UPI00384D9722
MADNKDLSQILDSVVDKVKLLSKEELLHRLNNTRNKVFTEAFQHECDLFGFYHQLFSKESHYQIETILVDKEYEQVMVFEPITKRSEEMVVSSSEQGGIYPCFFGLNTSQIAA